MNFLIYTKELWRGKGLYRILMNMECSYHTLQGRVLDVGSGTSSASYHRFFNKSKEMKITALDLGFEKKNQIDSSFTDLERDKLPMTDNSIDTVLIFNLLEHIYNYSFLISEIKRVLRPGGRVIGAVPFLGGYHPDPKDYWRYTSDTLLKIFDEHGFKNIEIKVLGKGPFAAAFSQIEFMLPRLLKILFLPTILILDRFILALKPALNRQKFALGLFFSFSK